MCFPNPPVRTILNYVTDPRSIVNGAEFPPDFTAPALSLSLSLSLPMKQHGLSRDRTENGLSSFSHSTGNEDVMSRFSCLLTSRADVRTPQNEKTPFFLILPTIGTTDGRYWPGNFSFRHRQPGKQWRVCVHTTCNTCRQRATFPRLHRSRPGTGDCAAPHG